MAGARRAEAVTILVQTAGWRVGRGREASSASRSAPTSTIAAGHSSPIRPPDDGATSSVRLGYDDYLFLVGASGADALDALCTGRDLPEIP